MAIAHLLSAMPVRRRRFWLLLTSVKQSKRVQQGEIASAVRTLVQEACAQERAYK